MTSDCPGEQEDDDGETDAFLQRASSGRFC